MQNVDLVLAERYKARERLGSGAETEEYLGRDLRLDRPVVIQVIRGTGQDDLAPLARRMASLDHPAVASVYDWGQQEDGITYLVREYVPGLDLATLLARRGPLPAGQAAAIGAEVAAALAATHRIGLAHGSLGLADVIIGEQRVTVVGFGEGSGDLQRDLDALGVMLRQMVAGTPPAWVAGPTAGTRIPVALGQIIGRLRAADPVDRYRSAEAVRADLLHVSREPVEYSQPLEPMAVMTPAGAPGPSEPGDAAGRPARRWRRWVAALVGLLLVGVGVAAAFVLTRSG